VIAADWDEFRNLDVRRMRARMGGDKFLHCRNAFEPVSTAELGFDISLLEAPIALAPQQDRGNWNSTWKQESTRVIESIPRFQHAGKFDIREALVLRESHGCYMRSNVGGHTKGSRLVRVVCDPPRACCLDVWFHAEGSDSAMVE
jgi:hypothetical protein